MRRNIRDIKSGKGWVIKGLEGMRMIRDGNGWESPSRNRKG